MPLIVIVVFRYMAIVHPLRPRMKHQTAYCLITGVWIVPVLISIPSAYFASATKVPMEQTQQDLLRPDLDGGPAAVLPLVLPVHLRRGVRGPVLTMALCYLSISREALVQERAGFPNGADPQTPALPQEDGHGADCHSIGVHPLLGSVLRLHHPA